MPRKHPGHHANRIAYDLYVKFLDRSPDPGGHKYILQSLQEGRKSVRQHVIEIVGSEEFRRKFVRNRSKQNAVQHLHKVMLGRTISDPYRLARQAADLAIMDLVPYAERLTSSADYRQMYGEDQVPGPVQPTRLD